MTHPPNISLHKKLLRLNIFTSGMILLLVCGLLFLYDYLSFIEAVRDHGSTYGKTTAHRLWLYFLLASVAISIYCTTVYLFSQRLQKMVSQPIMALVETARAISEQNDYSVRVSKKNDDEIGMLTDAFNHMLLQIELQNAEMASFSQQLEEKVAERTHQLEQTNKELEAFSYSISHDLRAPLRSIDSYSKILVEEYHHRIDLDGQKSLHRIMNNAKMMGKQIDALLEFSTLGKKVLNKGYVDMNDIVQKVLAELHEEIQQRNIEVKVGDLAPSMADMGLIRQVWINLVSNAIKYTKNTERAYIEITSNMDHPVEVIYCIKDNGAGFDMQYSSKLFGVFQRLHKERDFSGIGAGLAIVHRIIHKHGGRIWADAKVDAGACFCFTLSKLKL